jgi:integral membrane sensor domain MASE1
MSFTDERRRAKLDRYEARTEMEMNERRAHLQMHRIERGAFLVIAILSALMAVVFTIAATPHHSIWNPSGALSLIALSGSCATRLHFL